ISGWNISSLGDVANGLTEGASEMLSHSGMSTINYDKLLVNWNNQVVASKANASARDIVDVEFSADGLNYCMGEAARTNLLAEGWGVSQIDVTNFPNTITDFWDAGANCGDAFITTWQLNASDPTVHIPVPDTGVGYDFLIDWGDGTIQTRTDTETEDRIIDGTTVTGYYHDYSSTTGEGLKTIRIAGDFPQIYFQNSGDKDKIQTVEQWGTIVWSTMYAAFWGCNQLNILASDAPELGNVESLELMFRNCTSLNPDLSDWDVSNIKSMKNLFSGCSIFTGDFDWSEWNTSNVTDMTTMFYECTVFNGDITDFNIGNVTDIRYMLAETAFDRNIGHWNISSIQPGSPQYGGARNMLDNCAMSVENYDNLLIGWRTNYPTKTGVVLGAKGLRYCLGAEAHAYLRTTNGWVINEDSEDCSHAFITTWQLDAADPTVFIPIDGDGYDFSIDWGDGTLQTRTNNQRVYRRADGTLIPGYMHYYDPGITNPSIKIVGDFPQIYFNNAGDKDKIQSIDNWGTIEWRSMESAFHGCTNLTYNAMDNPNLSHVSSMSNMFRNARAFNGNIGSWSVGTVVDMSNLFMNAGSFNQDLSGWDVGNVEDMSLMFYWNNSFNNGGQPLSWGNKTAKVNNMGNMFDRASAFNQDISSWDVSSVKNMSYMFNAAETFNNGNQPLDWGNSTAGVEDMTYMF
ncbi:MAG: DUF285 domain-containing protein, partial [Bacteroidales bacterium]|nr:DUF285 domain-containing protein [Bacteroidales bacterium]